VRSRSPVGAKYDRPVNRESAYEMLSQRAITETAPAARPHRPTPVGEPTPPPGQTEPAPSGGGLGELMWGTKRRQGMVETLAKQAARTVGSEIGRQILRGVLGGILGGTRRR
jgi:uncharacterized protein